MLRVSELKKAFINNEGERIEAVNIPSFNLNSNESIAIAGESGSGKSTFLNLISGVLNPDSGKIIFDETVVNELTESKRDLFRAKNIGYIFQTFNLLQGYTALENVLLGMIFAGNADKKKALDALNKVGLSGRKNNKPSELSVGEQQRVAIARAIVNTPKLLLADEPTANLDSKNARIVIDVIKNLCEKEKISLIIVTHQQEVISNFSNVINFLK